MLYLGLADDRGEDEQDEYVDELDETGADVAHDYQAPVTPLHRALGPREVPADEHVGGRAAADHDGAPAVVQRRARDRRGVPRRTPVIMNLSDMDDADAKRLVDFSAGLIFGLHGAIERVTNKVFLLSPEHVEITGEQAAAPAPGRAGFYNQS